MSKVEFFFDPVCPFSWITSRWLLQVQRFRDIDIEWRQFSLALKNNELVAKVGESEHAVAHRESHRIQRVIYEAVNKYGASSIELYSEFGMRHHIMEEQFSDKLIREVLELNKLPAVAIEVADDSSLDVFLQNEIEGALEVVGSDTGVPVIIFSDENGVRSGYFGPVLNELPKDEAESLAIWDGLEQLAAVSSFFELKRSRPGGSPNVYSTARC